MRTVLLGLTLCVACSAANHYVVAGIGGTHTGVDWSTAYSSIPATLTRGDTYYIAVGSYGSYTFDDSGTSTITLKHPTIASHGTDTGWQDGYAGQAVWTDWDFTTGNYTIDGVTGGGPGSWETGFGFKVAMPISGGQAYAIGTGSSSNVPNIVLRHIDIVGRGRAYGGGDTDLFYFVNGYSNWTISYCFLRDTDRTMILSWPSGGSGMTIEYSKFARNGVAEHREAWSDSTDSNVIVRYNLFEDIFGTGIIAGVNGAGNTSNWDIYGNVIYWTGTYNDGNLNTGIFVVGHSACPTNQCLVAVNWHIYNNVIVNAQTNSFTSSLDIESISGSPGVVCENNIWYNNHDQGGSGCGQANVQDYNWFYNNTANGTSGSHDTIGSSNPFVNWQAGNWGLSYAIPGLALASPYNVDPLGNTRGADGVFDRGAYEYGAAACTVAPTTLGPYTAGTAVSQQFTASNCTSSTWGITGNTGSGLTLNSSTGLLTGVPTGGTFNLTITYDTASQPITLTINYASITTTGIHAEPALPTLPARGQTFVDGVYGTTILRATDSTDDATGCRVAYGLWPVFNSNSTKVLAHCAGGAYVYDFNGVANPLTNKVSLPAVFLQDDVIWSHTNPNILYYRTAFPDSNCAFASYNLNTMTGTVVHDFYNDFPANPPTQPLGCMIFRATMSEDDDMYCAARRLDNNDTNPYDGWVCYKLSTQTVYSELPAHTGHYFKIHVDKNGQWLWNVADGGTSLNSPSGSSSINIATGAIEFAVAGATDYSPGHMAMGPGYVVGVSDPGDTRRNMNDIHNYTLVKAAVGDEGSTTHEYSMLNTDSLRYTTISETFGWPHSQSCSFCYEVYSTTTDGTEAVRRYVHHFNKADGTPQSYDYNQIPQASISYDGRFIAFDSDWGVTTGGRRDIFIFATGLSAAGGSRISGSVTGKWQ